MSRWDLPDRPARPARPANEREMYLALIALGLAELRFGGYRGRSIRGAQLSRLTGMTVSMTDPGLPGLRAREFLNGLYDVDSREAASNRTLDRLRGYQNEMFQEVALIEAGIAKLKRYVEAGDEGLEDMPAFQGEAVTITDADVIAFGEDYVEWAQDAALEVAYGIEEYERRAREWRTDMRHAEKALKAMQASEREPPPEPGRAPLCASCGKRPRHWGDLCKRCTPPEQRPTGKVA